MKILQSDLEFLLEKIGMAQEIAIQVLNSRTGEIDRKTALLFQSQLNTMIGAAAIINQQFLAQDFREEDKEPPHG